MKQFTPLELPLYKKHYSSSYKQFDKYFLFIERGLDLLKPKGYFGYIVPISLQKLVQLSPLQNYLFKINQ